MKKIQLDRMELRNFKGVNQAVYEFGDLTIISGDNATGKSTIFDAYLWCLFDKNQQGNTPKVQPLDENNEVKHKLTTSVRLDLKIDGMPFIVERSLKEDWSKPRGTTELVCKGTKSEYTINEVPMSKTQYNAKLEEIAPLDKWFLLSAVGIIPNMDQKTCRAELQAIAPAIDEKTIAKPFPAVLEALSKGLNIDELQAMTKQTKSKTKAELDTIPAALEAQDRLRVEGDFEAVEQQLNEIKAEIVSNQAEIDRLQTAVVDEAAIQKANEQRKQLSEINLEYVNLKNKAESDYETKRTRILRSLEDCEAETQSLQRRLEVSRQTAEYNLKNINIGKEDIARLRNMWIEKNAEVYKEPQITTTCPTCGQMLPTDRMQQAKEKAYQVWNEEKVQYLQQLQQHAEDDKLSINRYVAANDRLSKEDQVDLQRLDEIAAEAKKLGQELNELIKPEDTLAANADFQALLAKKQDLEEQIKQEAEQPKELEWDKKMTAMLKAKQADLQAHQENLVKQLAGRDLNARVDAERTRLENLQRQLADTLANAEGTEAQIAAFRKAKITAVENSVSSLFTIVHWKMYEPNVTNDGEKEICQAIIDGVPYEQQNRATQINAGIDIVNAFSTAYQVTTPIFIDNAEAVNRPLDGLGQAIRLQVSKDKTLQFTRAYSEDKYAID